MEENVVKHTCGGARLDFQFGGGKKRFLSKVDGTEDFWYKFKTLLKDQFKIWRDEINSIQNLTFCEKFIKKKLTRQEKYINRNLFRCNEFNSKSDFGNKNLIRNQIFFTKIFFSKSDFSMKNSASKPCSFKKHANRKIYCFNGVNWVKMWFFRCNFLFENWSS